ncbi:MAG: hypothetical protein JKY67_10280 [Pseudomonadales bacterium]|nr:hypothetical protein [Pseudomonadales bacterium]
MATRKSKTKVLQVRITPQEEKKFREYAADMGIGMSKLQRKMVREVITNTPDLIVEEMVIFRDAVRNVAGISRNFNQLTRLANAGKFPKRLFEESYYLELRSEIKDLKEKLDSIIDATENRWIKKEAAE